VRVLRIIGVAIGFVVLSTSCRTRPGPTVSEPVAHADSIAEGIDCANCHTPEGWRIAGSDSDGAGFDHAQTGFPLSGRHDDLACTDCHRPGRQVQRDCVSCHADVHQGRLSTRCDSCHSARGFHLIRALEIHRRTLLPLTGMHVLAECTECHQRRGERFLSNVPADCYACHEDDYRRPGVHPNHLGDADSPAFPRDCAQCHRPIGWTPAVIDLSVVSRSSALTVPADHDLRFPISFGAHRAAQCQNCHTVPSVPSLVRCTGCHEHSPVQIQLNHPNLHVATDGPGCLSCHPGGMAR